MFRKERTMYTTATTLGKQATRFLDRLENLFELDYSSYYISLGSNPVDPNNIFDMIKNKNYRHLVLALLQAVNFYDEDFSFERIPNHSRIAYHYRKLNGCNLPAEIKLEANIYGYTNFTAVQKAILDTNTLKLRYTTYTVYVGGHSNFFYGCGKLPVAKNGEFDFDRYIPFIP